MRVGDLARGVEVAEDSGVLSEEPVYSIRPSRLGLESSLVRSGDNFRGEGGGLRAVALIGN